MQKERAHIRIWQPSLRGSVGVSSRSAKPGLGKGNAQDGGYHGASLLSLDSENHPAASDPPLKGTLMLWVPTCPPFPSCQNPKCRKQSLGILDASFVMFSQEPGLFLFQFRFLFHWHTAERPFPQSDLEPYRVQFKRALFSSGPRNWSLCALHGRAKFEGLRWRGHDWSAPF